MNRQGVFNQIAKHLLTQMEKSSDGISCQYRDPSGNRCAIGAIIPEEIYVRGMECGAISHLVETFPQLLTLWNIKSSDESDPDIDLLGELQFVHDHIAVSGWEWELGKCASKYNLEFDKERIKGNEATDGTETSGRELRKLQHTLVGATEDR